MLDYLFKVCMVIYIFPFYQHIFLYFNEYEWCGGLSKVITALGFDFAPVY